MKKNNANTDIELMTLIDILEALKKIRERVLSHECTPRDARRFFSLASAHDTIMQAKGIVGQQNGSTQQPKCSHANSARFKPDKEPIQNILGNHFPSPG